MSKQYDVIVVGAGHNGLIVAGYLAKAGLSTCVLEKNSFIGGATNSVECTLPGFKHDIGGIVHAVIRGNPLLTEDELGLYSKYGLEYVCPDPYVANLFADDTALILYKDADKTCEEIAKYSDHDAEAYRKFLRFAEPMLPLMGHGMFNPPPPFGMMMAQLDSTPAGREMIRTMMMSAWDVANQWFEHPKTLLKCLKISSEIMVGPEEKGTGVLLLLAVPSAHHHPGALAVGGSGALAEALRRQNEAHGGVVLTNSEVVKVITKGGKATGVVLKSGEEIMAKKAVVCNVDPRISINKWVDEGISAEIKEKVSRMLNPSFSGIMVALALDEAPRYKASPVGHTACFVEPLPADVDDFRRMFDDMKYGLLPQQKCFAPFVVVPTEHDPSRAPAGKHVCYLWNYVPYSLKDGGTAKWASIKEDVADKLQEFMFSYTTNMTPEKVLKRTVFSPVDLENFNNNIVNGGVVGPGAFLNQMYSYRPIPEMGNYRTPVEGLYLSGMSTHPGGAIGGGGRSTVQIIMHDLGIDFDDVVS